MKLIETEDFMKAAKLSKFGGESVAKLLMLLLKLNKINKFYSRNYDKAAIEFIDAVIEELDLKFEVSDEEINRIPLKGPFITISNHPYGGIDGILLLKIITMARPDFKVMANFLLQKVEPLKDFFMGVNPFETHKGVKSSVGGLKDALNKIREGTPLGIFPAGEVSTYNEDWTDFADRQWQNSVLKFIKKAEVPIVPVYFQGTNSKIFHILGLIHPLLRTVKLPSELFNKKNRIIRIRIGNPISVAEQNEFSDIARYGRFLRAKTYALGTPIEVKKFFIPGLKRSAKVEDIIDPVPKGKILQEVEMLNENHLLFQSGNFKVFCAPALEMPSILSEIGRLREITFREVGEGTNRKLDIDEFDLYYNQLFVWDNETNQVVGAYRAGKGKEIMEKYGVRGFYIQSLFKIAKPFYPILEQAIELGRSFVVKEYQRKPMSLFLLWKGILYFLIKNPEYRYLIGPVSISNRFSNFSKRVIMDFIKANYYNEELAKYIKPRNSFEVPETSVDTEIILGESSDLNKLDKFIKDVDPSNYNMPVLLKKYLKQNGKIICFNTDPKFNNALDGLIINDLFDIPMDTITSLSKEINDETILERFSFPEGNMFGPHPAPGFNGKKE
jgi:putative hemolysin